MSWFDTFLNYSFLPLYAFTVLVSIIRYRDYFDTPLKYFPILLMYTLLNELLGYLIRTNEFEFVLSDIYKNNNWIIYNIYNIVFFLYFLYVYWMYVKNRRYRNIIAIGAVAFLLVAVINPFFQRFLFESQVFAYIAGAIVLIVTIMLFYAYNWETFGIWFRNRNLLSWLSLGMLIFYLFYIPIKIIRLQRAALQLNDIPIVRRTHLVLILIMYGCFIVGFIRMGKEKG